ncbi:ThuA domain-containing protein [Allostreptomyces psammosilenae]|uniref:Trehalose utilization protein n=1 Tax=Allostreptomyces psammosilenae TaxID=1892865 RepID=A0A853A0D4_9ACTN|nr:ThuA domain-containing protein [Allostreptomyces psammosilenae]NYI03848.1 trehalose utilization protein [Allostreptomyces psammosilenae]
MSEVTTARRLRVTVWNENVHETTRPAVAERYPDGIHGAVASAIVEHHGDAVSVRTATLDEPEHGLTEEVLAATDVLVWWGNRAHHRVADEVAERVQRHVLAGMGFVPLHSAHWSKPFVRLMGTTCTLNWRSAEDRELVWTVAPGHPVAAGVPSPVVIDRQEMYGEPFDVPQPDELVFISSFSGGEVFRSGCAYRRGSGRIFYFSPGDQDYPVYDHPDVRRVIANAVAWSAPTGERRPPELRRRETGWFEEKG